MTRAIVYPNRAAAERAIDALTEAHAPGGVETVRVVSRGRVVSEEQRPAKPWSEPIELDDGRFAVPVSPRKLTTIAGREVTVRGERVRVPRAQDVSEVEITTDDEGEPVTREDGRPVLREKRREAPATPVRAR